MSDIHPFITEDTPDMLPADWRERIAKKQTSTVSTYCKSGMWYDDDIREAISTLMEKGYFPKGALPPEHKATLNKLFADPEHHGWTVIDDANIHREPMHGNDILLVGGVVAADILKPDEFWSVPAGFSGPSDVQGTVGAMLLQNRDLFFDRGGYSWDSEESGKRYRSKITGSIHGDLRIERICVSYKPTTDPFGKPVRYQPLTSRDHQCVAAYHSCEPTLLAAVLKYIDQEKIDVPCLADKGQALLADLKSHGQHIGNFGDFGQDGLGNSARHIFFDYAFPMNEAAAEHGAFFHLMKEHGGAYRIHMDEKRHLAFSMIDEKHGASRPSLTFPPEEMDHVVRGIFTQAQQGKGRTSIGQLERILAYRFSDSFENEMAETYKSVAGDRHQRP